MHDVAAVALLAATVAALTFTRLRSMFMRMAAEAALLIAIGSLLFWQGTSPLPMLGSLPVGLASAWARALAVIWWLIGARLVVNITAAARGRDPKIREARLFSDLAGAIIYITTILIILHSVLNFDVRSVLVTSGVIAIVLGLALQSTLADVFAGIAVGLEHPVHVGDRVSLGDIEGVIVQMNWRSIRIQTDGDDLATVPNSMVAKGQIINRSVPTRRRAVTVEIVAPSDVVSETVIDLVQQAALLCPIVLSSPAPSITLRHSGLRSSTYAVSFFVADSPDVGAAKSLLLRRVGRLFRTAGIGRAAPMSPIDLLRDLVLFEALSQAELEGLAKELTLRVVEPGDTIFEQGSVSASIYVIEAGVMEVVRHDLPAIDGTIGRIGAGDYIGELGLITGAPRACSMTALTHGRVHEVSGGSLSRLLASNAALKAAMERSVRKGLAAIERNDTARAEHMAEPAVNLAARIRAFFEIDHAS
jgi:small-conductance mechanosensitive channel/CRP-like cAMP-binding protein